jgi:hypothetical protein
MRDHRSSAAGSYVEAVQAPYRAALNAAELVRQRNINYFLTLAELTDDMIREPSPETLLRSARTLADERVKQREALGAVISETTNACLDFFYAPFYYLRGD